MTDALPVLVANQHPDIARLVAGYLERLRIPVAGPVGPGALAALRDPAARFGAVVLDRAADEAGGLAVVAELRARGDRTPVVLMGGSFVGALPLPPRVWFLTKPFTQEQLAAVVRAALSAGSEEDGAVKTFGATGP